MQSNRYLTPCFATRLHSNTSLFLLPSLASRFSFRTKAWEESGERRSAENRKRPEGGGVRKKMETYIMCAFWIIPLGECQRSKALSHKCLEPSRFCFLGFLPARRVAFTLVLCSAKIGFILLTCHHHVIGFATPTTNLIRKEIMMVKNCFH